MTLRLSIAEIRSLTALFAALLALVVAAAPSGAMETSARQAILLDSDTGAVLFEKAADEPMVPASMTKMMTAYIAFERIREGRLKLEDEIPISEKAWKMGGSKMFVMVGTRVKVEDILRGIIVQSGNDASIAIAEALSGSEEAFAEEMTRVARALGMASTTFKNSTGWPEPGHVSTARDLATLAVASINKHPEFYHYYKELTFTYNGIRQGNRNPLLYKSMGVDGLKTGHTEESGYGLTASAVRDGRRLVLVVNGLAGVNPRSREAEALLEYGFREFDNYALFKAGQTVVDADVWLGDLERLPLVIDQDVTVTLPRKARRGMKVAAVLEEPLPAPIARGQQVATLRVTGPDMEPIERPLVAGAAVEQLGPLGRFSAAFQYLLWGARE